MYEGAYMAERFVELAPQPAEVRDVRETNICRLHVALSEHTGKIVVLSAIDNLWKGTSSQAVQNLNVMFGLPEAEGLA
jgi:N-acetyl-gamma-glutamyl-phosphate reductase